MGEVDVRARVTGYLMKVNFEDGQNVKKGRVAVRDRPASLPGDFDRPRRLGAADGPCGKGQFDLARSDRLRPSGAVSQDEYEQHVANLAVHKAIDPIGRGRGSRRPTESRIHEDPSPIDGRVSRTRITEGNLVQPGADEAPC